MALAAAHQAWEAEWLPRATYAPPGRLPAGSVLNLHYLDVDPPAGAEDAFQARLTASAVLAAFDPHEARDREGKWTSGPGGGVSVLSQDDLKPEGLGSTEQVIEHAAKQVAARWKVADADLRELAAEERVTLPADPAEARRVMAYAVVRGWSGSAGGPIITAAATHVADRLGLPYTLAAQERGPVKYIRDHPGMDRATRSLGDAIYGGTQAWLKERGITRLHVMRSSRGAEFDKARPYTSWTLHPSGLRHERGRETVEADVPAARVFSLPPTGPGTVAESEVVLLPGAA